VTKKEEFRRKLCYDLGGEYCLRDFCSFKQIYRRLDDEYELEIGFFDLRGKKLIITLFKDKNMVEAVYAALSYKEIELTIKNIVEKYTCKEFIILQDEEKTRQDIVGLHKKKL
jgi:hypothetical protein